MNGTNHVRRFATLTPGVLALTLAMFASSASAETAEEAIRRLDAKSKAVATAHFTQIITNTSQMVDSKSVSEVWQKRDADGKMRMRTEVKSEMTMKGIDMPPQKTEAITVVDGDVLWSQMDNMGMTMVTKMKMPPESQQGLVFLLDYMEKGNGRLLDPETIDGQKCVVVEYNMDDMMGGMTVIHRAWIAEENGMMLKSVTKGGDMAGTTEMLVKDVKTGVAIDDSKFTYTVPEGAQVMDYTGM